jgi:ABC-type phosphate transport system substrate-binding protein
VRAPRLFVALFVALVVSSCVPPGGGPSGVRSLTVTPGNELEDQVVQVHWTGFTPTDIDSGFFNVTIFQCKGAVPRTLADCFQNIRPPSGGDPDGTGIQDAITRPDGAGTAFLEVRPANNLPELDCTATSPCSVVAFENDGAPIPTDGLPTTAVTAKLEFAKSPSDCPAVSSFDVTTSGEASFSRAMYAWRARLCTGAKALAVDYTELSSPAGRDAFVAGNVDLGLTSTRADAHELAGKHRSFTYAPLDVSAVAVVFNVTDGATSQRITEMTLTPRLVAMLIAGHQIGTGPGTHLFDDPEFLALNPGHVWPVNTQPPMLRAETNADAWILTNWLQHDHDARAYLDGKDARGAEVDEFWKGITYPTDTFEARDPTGIGTYNPRTGTLVNARRVFNFQGPGDGVSVSPLFDGILGITDVVTAREFGLPMAKLRAANSTAAAVAPDAAGLTAGVAAMQQQTGTGGVTGLADPGAGGGAYPLTKVDYAMVPTSGISRAHAEKVAQFLDYAAGDGQAPTALAPGYLPLTPPLKVQTAAVATTLRGIQDSKQTTSTTNPDAAAPTTAGSTPPAGDTFIPSDGGYTPSDSSSYADTNSGAAPPIDPNKDASGAPPSSSAAGSDDGRDSNPVLKPVAFLGASHELVLPFVLGFGLVALAAGPVLTLLARRKPRPQPASPAPQGP